MVLSTQLMEDECDGLGSDVCSGADRPKKRYCIDRIGNLVVVIVRFAVDKFMDEATSSGLQERDKGFRFIERC